MRKIFTLHPILTAGTYTKVNVTSYGTISSGGTLVESDIPGLDWSKIITGAVNLSSIESLVGTTGLLKKVANGSWILDTSTYLTANQSISISGDATGSGSTSIILSLSNTGVSAGSYPKVTVDTKGRVTSGTSLSASDIPGLDWSKIISGNSNLSAIENLGGTSGILRKTDAGVWTLDLNNYLTANQSITISGDATGAGSTTIALTLSNTGVTAGTYPKVTVDAKGRVTAGTTLSATDIPALSWSKITSGLPTTLSGYGITDAQPLDADLTSIAGLAGTTGLLRKTDATTWTLDTTSYITASYVSANFQGLSSDLTSIASIAGTSGILSKTGAGTWTLDTNTYLTGNQNITVTGDATGSGATSISVTLANSGVTAGTYTKVTVDAKGRVTTGTALSATDIPALDWTKITTGTPTTLAGYGITDAQAASATLTAISSVSGNSGVLRKTSAFTWDLDTSLRPKVNFASKQIVYSASGNVYRVIYPDYYKELIFDSSGTLTGHLIVTPTVTYTYSYTYNASGDLTDIVLVS